MNKRIPALFFSLFLLSACSTPPPASAPTEGSSLAVHFIDVGQADAALLVCDGETMLIDGGNVADSSLVVSYLETQGIDQLDYVFCTHAHEDHVGGLSGPLNTCTASHVYAPVTTYDSKAFENFVKYTQAQGRTVEVPSLGDSYTLGDAKFTIVGPVKEYNETNNTSLVIRCDYGETSFLFTGDMERDAEADLLDSGADLSATVLKVGHHGSDTSTSYPFLREVMPTYAVVSVGEGNSYGHPSKDTLSRLSDAGTTVYRTDEQGTVIAVSDGKTVTFTTSTTTAPAPGRNQPTESTYVGNKNSNIFHTERCKNLPDESNRTYFTSRDEAVDAGYSPCGNCKP